MGLSFFLYKKWLIFCIFCANVAPLKILLCLESIVYVDYRA